MENASWWKEQSNVGEFGTFYFYFSRQALPRLHRDLVGVKYKNLEFNSICLPGHCNENFKGAKQFGNKGEGGASGKIKCQTLIVFV